MSKTDQTIKVMGVDIPRWQDCSRCKAKLACEFNQFAYSQPCIDCKSTKEYEQEQSKPKERSMDDIFAARKPAAVFTHKGRNIYTNHKGDIIKDEPYRPLKSGK